MTLSNEQINDTIVDFEAQLFSNQPEFTTKEEYAIYEQWTQERKIIANQFKALLVSGNINQAEKLYNQYTQ